jgi:hypothetical protein
MLKEKRKSQRKTVNRHAKIQAGAGALPRDCLVSDISEGGVRLHVENVDVPDRFALLLADGEGHTWPRDCRVVWRLGHEVGAKFLDLAGRRTEPRSTVRRPAEP